MQAILPGKPQAKLQAITTGTWEEQLVVAYISGTASVILNGPHSLLQTIYHDDSAPEGSCAVTYDERTGKIAAASAHHIHVYGSREEIKGELRWVSDITLHLPHQDDPIRTLSWGSDEELLAGSTHNITLYTTHISSTPSSPTQDSIDSEDPHLIWSRSLASPIHQAYFSPSASFIATASPYSRLVKIWRRQSFEAPLFDYAYLRHTDVVTHIEWRRAGHGEDAGGDETLYTICADGKFRVWRAADPHGTEISSLYGEIDMMTAIQAGPTSASAQPERRYAFVIPADSFAGLVSSIADLGQEKDGRNNHASEHLKEVASRNPEIVVIFDHSGHMSAWGLAHIGCKKRNSDASDSLPFHVVQIEELPSGLRCEGDGVEDNIRVLSLPPLRGKGIVSFLAHHFDGRIAWWEGQSTDLFNASPRKSRVRRLADWTGHSAEVKKVIRTASGKALVSRTTTNKSIVWTQLPTRNGILRRSKTELDEHIHRTALLRSGDFVVHLHHESISLWDARGRKTIEVSRCEYSIKGKPLCSLASPENDSTKGAIHLATVSSESKGVVWELILPQRGRASTNGHTSNGAEAVSMRQYCTFESGDAADMAYFLPVDPAGSSPVVTGFLDSFAPDVAISYTHAGFLQTWTARTNTDQGTVEWLVTSSVNTGIKEPTLASGTSIRRAALVSQDRTTLTIWDTKGARSDYEETYPGQRIQDLDWAATPDNQSILAVGFSHRVLVYTQLRYDYVDERPSWACIKTVSIRDSTPHPIGDSVWLGGGNLVICAGNQLFLTSDTIDPVKDIRPDLRVAAPHKISHHIHDIVRRMNGPLPVFHPQLISQCILAGKTALAQQVLVKSNKTLKFYTEGDDLDSGLGFAVEDYLSDIEDTKGLNGVRSIHKSFDALNMDDEPTTVTEEVAASLSSLLAEKSVPQSSGRQQSSLVDIVDCVATVEKHRRSVDENATRFSLSWRERMSRARQSDKDAPTTAPSAAISWRVIIWAYHSHSQDILIDLISRHHKGRVEWVHARDAGIFMWITDREALSTQFEAVGRNAYSSSEPKNPVDCTLHYLALRKKAVLLGLWRMATWSREQAATMRLLKNDFTDPRWKTAAAKNAYALMGKRRFEYAAAFFLLADDLKSTMSVLSNQLGDIQLAITVGRVYGGDDSEIVKTFIKDKVLPLAAAEGNRWQSSWAYWLMGQRSLAVRALVSPLYTLSDPPGSPPESHRAKSFLNDDPASIVLYRQSRERSLQTLKGAMMITGTEEWAFVVKTAALLRRMGCDVSASDLVRNWEFLRQQMPTRQTAQEIEEGRETVSDSASPTGHKKSALDGYDVDPRKLLRRRSSSVVADMPSVETHGKPGPPDVKPASSILDAWGNGDGAPVAQTKEDKVAEAKRKVEEAKKKRAEREMNEKKPAPTNFQEPDPNSSSDSFGF